MTRLVTDLGNRALHYQLAEVSEIAGVAGLWKTVRIAGIAAYFKGGSSKAIRTFKLSNEQAQQLRRLPQAQVSLAIERALMHIAAVEEPDYELVQVKVENATFFLWNAWRCFIITVVMRPRPML